MVAASRPVRQPRSVPNSSGQSVDRSAVRLEPVFRFVARVRERALKRSRWMDVVLRNQREVEGRCPALVDFSRFVRTRNAHPGSSVLTCPTGDRSGTFRQRDPRGTLHPGPDLAELGSRDSSLHATPEEDSVAVGQSAGFN